MPDQQTLKLLTTAGDVIALSRRQKDVSAPAAVSRATAAASTSGSSAMRRVLVESPYAGEVAANVEYARAAVLDCLRRGEAPYASHLFFPQVLDDLQADERALGIEAGLAWGEAAEATVVYVDRGISPGMKLGIARAHDNGRPVEYRRLPVRRGGRAA